MSNGCAVELSPGCRIGVDYWSSRAKDLQACFLTHAHTDHTQGLSDKWAGPDIHCTEQTKQIITNKWPKLEAKIVIISTGDTLEMVLRNGGDGHVVIQITPIDARHCPVRAVVNLSHIQSLDVSDWRCACSCQQCISSELQCMLRCRVIVPQYY